MCARAHVWILDFGVGHGVWMSGHVYEWWEVYLADTVVCVKWKRITCLTVFTLCVFAHM